MKQTVNTPSKIVQAFELEYLRNRLAQNRNVNDFINTYNKNNPEIANTNSGNKWDKLNVNIDKSKNPMAFDRINSLKKYISGKNLKILNFGFGQGALESELYKMKPLPSLIGIDISSKSVKKAQKKFKKWVFIVGGIERVKVYKNSFDYVVCSEVLEHISPRNTLATLRQFYKCLKPGGYLLVSVPLNEGLERLIENGFNPNSHTRIYTPDIIKMELKISGFNYLSSEFLFAFKKGYFFKKIIANFFINIFFKPNVMIVFSQKP
jgi:ubiquinone/menaquinone biosynthesis C-methylase UbiE